MTEAKFRWQHSLGLGIPLEFPMETPESVPHPQAWKGQEDLVSVRKEGPEGPGWSRAGDPSARLDEDRPR